MRGFQRRREPAQTQARSNDESFNKKPDMKRTTASPLMAAILAAPGTMSGAVSLGLPPLPDSRKLIQVNRVDRVSTNADWIRIEWPTGSLSAPATLTAALAPIDAPAPANDFSPPASEPAAIASSSRVGLHQPTLDPRSIGKRNRPS